MKKISREQFEQKILDLETKNKELVDSANLCKTEHQEQINKLILEHETNIKTLEDKHGVQVEEMENKVSTLTEEVGQKQEQIDRKELKKLAQAYEDQETIYKEGSEQWLNWLIRVAVALMASTAFSIYLSSSKNWYDKFEYYLVDIIFLSAVWFCGAQYTDQVKLRNDYANRKTVAQSFHNILNNLSEDEPIKSKFIEKATDVLCAPSPVSGKEPVLSKKLIKDMADIISSIRG